MLLDDVRSHMRMRHLAKRTETAYVGWIRRFLEFEKQRRGDWCHPKMMDSTMCKKVSGCAGVNRFGIENGSFLRGRVRTARKISVV